MSRMHLMRATYVAAAGAAVVACTTAPAGGPVVAPTASAASYGLGQACPDVWAHANAAWGVIPQHFEGTFKDMLLNQERTGCRFSADVPAGEADARFGSLKSAMLNDHWSEDEYAASDTTAGMDRGDVICYSRFRREPAHVEIECFPRPGPSWRDD